MTLSPALSACAAIVERGDPDRFAATMAAPSDARPTLWPLYAFNVEVARASYASTEPMVAEMRLQWWADHLIDLDAGHAPSGEVAEALQPLIRRSKGLLPVLTAIAEARRQDCWPEPFPNREALWLYLDQTAGNLMWAAASSLGAADRHEHQLRAFAQAAGLANWLHALPELVRHNRLGLSGADSVVLGGLAKDGLAMLSKARAELKEVEPSARPALWTGWASAVRLKAAATDPVRIDEGRLGPPEAYRALALLWRTLTRAI